MPRNKRSKFSITNANFQLRLKGDAAATQVIHRRFLDFSLHDSFPAGKPFEARTILYKIASTLHPQHVVVVEMSEIKYGYPYPPQGPYQGPPPVAAPPQYYAAPPPKREVGFLEGCLAALCCCCLLDECCCDPTIIFAS
ncbi:hypothetical protein VNO77_22156 [Canavalia gladiata]|uniref:Cysteine-rich transmembrane domain-containing protein n=1 Tax=Canavalia gladiata TaxID=3824 RepID=A0AAN9L230_CANGL